MTILGTPVQVAAAMIAVVAEHEPWYNPQTTGLMNSEGRGCIQGAMLAKLGYDFTAEKEGLDEWVVTGSTESVLTRLGYPSVYGDTLLMTEGLRRLFEALSIAEQVNDAGLPWTAALEAFERVTAGEPYGELKRALYDAQDGLRQIAAKKRERNWTPAWTENYFYEQAAVELAAAKKLYEAMTYPQFVASNSDSVTFPVLVSA